MALIYQVPGWERVQSAKKLKEKPRPSITLACADASQLTEGDFSGRTEPVQQEQCSVQPSPVLTNTRKERLLGNVVFTHLSGPPLRSSYATFSDSSGPHDNQEPVADGSSRSSANTLTLEISYLTRLALRGVWNILSVQLKSTDSCFNFLC